MVKLRSRDFPKQVQQAQAPVVVQTQVVDLTEVLTKMQVMADEIAALKLELRAVKPPVEKPAPNYDFQVTRDVNGRIAAVKAVNVAVH